MDGKPSLHRAMLAIVMLIIIGTVIYNSLEGWNYVDSFYFTVMTVTTIGYGDFVPVTDSGKIFTSLFALVGIGIVLATITLGVNTYMQSHHKRLVNIEKTMKKIHGKKKRR